MIEKEEDLETIIETQQKVEKRVRKIKDKKSNLLKLTR